MKRKAIVYEWIQIVFGLLIFAFGVHLTIKANIGLAPWDCLGMGLSYHTPLSYGLSMTVCSLIILVVDLLLKERIGYGTIIDALCTGNFTQFFNNYEHIIKVNHLLTAILVLITGLFFMALGQCYYMKSAQCCGPRDAFLVAIGKRLSRMPIGAVSWIIFGIVLALGYLLGGPVGIGTLFSTFGAGIAMQIVFNALHFEPRDVIHRDLIEVNHEWMDSNK